MNRWVQAVRVEPSYRGSIPLPLARAPASPLADSFRVLRRRLARVPEPRIVAVASAARAEGKTTCAVGLAMALAEDGEPVLLVEANLRRPILAEALGFEAPAPGADRLALTDGSLSQGGGPGSQLTSVFTSWM